MNMIKTAMITGANRGIGLELTKKLIGEGWNVIALIKSNFPEVEQDIQMKIKEGQIRIYKADLSNFIELKLAIKDIKENEKGIDVLFNNAGGSFDKLYYSAQARELHFELHTVVPYILLAELKPLIKMGSHKLIVNTSTNAFNFIYRITYEDMMRPKKFKKLIGPYSTSKLAMTLWSQEISSELSKEGIKIICVDPGGNNTLRNDRKNGIPFFLIPITRWFFPHPSKGADILYKSSIGNLSYQSGAYMTKGKNEPLKFSAYSSSVLEEIKSIYLNDYLEERQISHD
ncbi:SDR family NAD(P)-dependent oxidoreductase [Paenibacillus tundrae]|uniref:NAD(P)-dependent dehydrogenase (Short-subunit alcohol dehydrogenase family) n=1 Tax=Paenibacillus tundrae TaxID=528187 RepID=A0ABT9WE63_9BACL|nr:SDR family NAD(P)-dependent oxidoreductase [Paenibacillus tundrae]MDQ0171319.1 NAD(P)-dependent dehydrogenase (short-subunit alcohol dehydrogenase family) [Paenibacillus tundrae]